MYTEGFEQLLNLNKNLTAPLSVWNHALTQMSNRIIQQNIELTGENFTRLSDQLKRFSNVKRPEELFLLQKECLNENISAGISGLQKMAQTTIETLEEFSKLCATSVEQGTTTLHKTVKEHSEREKERSR